jgi:hypothetical protein
VAIEIEWGSKFDRAALEGRLRFRRVTSAMHMSMLADDGRETLAAGGQRDVVPLAARSA